MATINLEVQHIDSLLPSIGRHGGVKISCDMQYRDIEEAVGQFREQLSHEDFIEILKATNGEDEQIHIPF